MGWATFLGKFGHSARMADAGVPRAPRMGKVVAKIHKIGRGT
jgi:hypothetical protein